MGVVMAAVLTACGGGGGGGGGGSASSDGTTTTPSTTPNTASGFPAGVTIGSPTALSGSAPAYQGLFSLVTAVAEGNQSLSSTGQASASALFDPATLSHAACYGPTVSYALHDDLVSATSGTLASGDVAMWKDDDTQTTGSPACSVSELNTQLGPITAQVKQALLLTAALRRVSVSAALPDPGATLDITTQYASAISGLLSGVTVQAASLSALSDASQYTYRLVLRRGSGNSAESIELVLLHTPNDTNERFAGVLQITHSRLSASSNYGCSDTVDTATGLYKVAHVTSLGYNRYDNALSTRLRSAQFCGAPTANSTSHFADLASVTESGEMDTTVFLNNTGNRNSTKGWKRELVRFSSDIELASFGADMVHSWQNTPQEGNGRVFLVHSGVSGGTRTAQIYHGFGGDLSTADSTLLGMYCNWAGPGASHTTINPGFQSQTVSLSNGASSWTRVASQIHYAPTNSCQSSSTMRFDANGDGTLGASEGNSFSNGLDVPTGGRTDAQSEAVERGYWPPTLY